MKQIPLTQGKVVLVDDADYEYLSQWKWNFNGWYAVRNSATLFGKRKTIYMHCEIVPHPDGFQTDHIDLDRLNNQRSNLRIATVSQNNGNREASFNNRSGFKGVYRREKNRFVAEIKIDNKRIYLGSFDSAEEAARAYDAKARELRREFARTNFLESES